MINHKQPQLNKANPRIRRQLLYADSGRGGTIRYINQKTSFDMWYELATGNAVVIIGIPSPQYWEAQTHTPLGQRTRILRFIGRQVIKDRLQGDSYFLLEDTILTIYSGRNPTISR